MATQDPIKTQEEKPWQKKYVPDFSEFQRIANDPTYDEQSPFLGIADEMKPEEDPEYQTRLRRASKTQAFSDVLSGLFDTAVSTAGGLVEKDNTGENQLRHLEDFNKERARLLAEKRELKSAKLQERMMNIKNNIDSKYRKQDMLSKAELARIGAEQQAVGDYNKAQQADYNLDRNIQHSKDQQSAEGRQRIDQINKSGEWGVKQEQIRQDGYYGRGSGKNVPHKFYNNAKEYVELTDEQANAVFTEVLDMINPKDRNGNPKPKDQLIKVPSGMAVTFGTAFKPEAYNDDKKRSILEQYATHPLIWQKMQEYANTTPNLVQKGYAGQATEEPSYTLTPEGADYTNFFKKDTIK